MTGFDRAAYERRQGEAYAKVIQTMRAMPQVMEALKRRTRLDLTCPRGHKLLSAALDDFDHDGREYLRVVPLDDYGRAGKAVARPDTPFRPGKSPCLVAGCPTLVEGDGRCELHGDRPAIDTGGLSTRFECRVQRCAWSSRLTQTRLLKVVAAALVVGHLQEEGVRVPLAGRGVPSR